MQEHPDRIECRKCRQHAQSFRYVDLLERVRLADDPADPNVGHFYLETIHILQCPACGHRQEHLQKRIPYATLREAQSQLDAHLLGKG
jgi:Zn finger protein HypA/HybF involved in hydrogenase expression